MGGISKPLARGMPLAWVTQLGELQAEWQFPEE